MPFQSRKTIRYIVLHGVENKSKRKEEIFKKENEAVNFFKKLDIERNVHADIYRKTVVRKETTKGNRWESKEFSSIVEEKTTLEKLT